MAGVATQDCPASGRSTGAVSLETAGEVKLNVATESHRASHVLTPIAHAKPYGASGSFFYVAFMPRDAGFIPHLCDVPYVGRMAITARTGERQQPTSGRFSPRSD